jgi:type IV pilus assembly protein PilC
MVGEQTGSLDNILEESALFYEEEVSQTMSNLPAIIEPVLIVVLGIGVGAMAVAVIMPIYSLSEQL